MKTRTIQTVGLILNSSPSTTLSWYSPPSQWCWCLQSPNLVQAISFNYSDWNISNVELQLHQLLGHCMAESLLRNLLPSLKVWISPPSSSEHWRGTSSVINAAVLLSCVFSSLLFFPMLTLDVVDSEEENHNVNSIANLTCPQPSFTIPMNANAYAAAALCLLCPIPLMIMLPTSIRMVIHLCAHTLALKKNQTQVQGSDSYLLVCKITISLVGVYMSTLCIVALFLIIRFIGEFITYHTLASAFSFYSGMTSLLLTASNRYLKEKLWSLFCCRKAEEQASKSQTVVTGVWYDKDRLLQGLELKSNT